MVVAQYLGQFFNGSIREFLGNSRADDAREPCLGSNALHHRRVWRDDDVILIHTPRVVAFGLEYADNTHGDRLKADGLADRVRMVAKKFLDYGCSYQTHLGGFLDIPLGKTLTLVNRPLANVEVVDGLAIHGRRRIVIAIDGLSAGGDLGRHLCYKPFLTEDALVVSHLQCLHG